MNYIKASMLTVLFISCNFLYHDYNCISKAMVKGKNITSVNGHLIGSSSSKNSNLNVSKYKILSQVKVKKYDLLAKKFFNSLNDDEKEALLIYTYKSRNINRFLSGEKHIKEIFYKDINKITKELDNIMQKFVLEDDIIVFKGANKKYFENLEVGQIFEPKYFFSTSVDKTIAEKFIQDKRNIDNPIMIYIKVPKESKSIYVGHDSGWAYNKEVILDRNTKYKVVEIQDNKLILEVVI